MQTEKIHGEGYGIQTLGEDYGIQTIHTIGWSESRRFLAMFS